jgi:ABC-2 type transport system ATP-binding protein
MSEDRTARGRPGDRGARPGQGLRRDPGTGRDRPTDQLAEQIAVIDRGRIVAEASSAQLKARAGSGTLRVRLVDGQQRSRAGAVLAGILEGPVQLGADPLTLSVLLAAPVDPADTGRLVGHVMTRLSEARVAVAEVTLGQPSLHEAFLALTGHP